MTNQELVARLLADGFGATHEIFWDEDEDLVFFAETNTSEGMSSYACAGEDGMVSYIIDWMPGPMEDFHNDPEKAWRTYDHFAVMLAEAAE